jgi:hypothetical protein
VLRRAGDLDLDAQRRDRDLELRYGATRGLELSTTVGPPSPCASSQRDCLRDIYRVSEITERKRCAWAVSTITRPRVRRHPRP